MSDMKQQTRTNGPFLKIAFALWVLGLCGAVLVLPYLATLETKAFAAAAADAREALGGAHRFQLGHGQLTGSPHVHGAQ